MYILCYIAPLVRKLCVLLLSWTTVAKATLARLVVSPDCPPVFVCLGHGDEYLLREAHTHTHSQMLVPHKLPQWPSLVSHNLWRVGADLCLHLLMALKQALCGGNCNLLIVCHHNNLIHHVTHTIFLWSDVVATIYFTIHFSAATKSKVIGHRLMQLQDK